MRAQAHTKLGWYRPTADGQKRYTHQNLYEISVAPVPGALRCALSPVRCPWPLGETGIFQAGPAGKAASINKAGGLCDVLGRFSGPFVFLLGPCFRVFAFRAARLLRALPKHPPSLIIRAAPSDGGRYPSSGIPYLHLKASGSTPSSGTTSVPSGSSTSSSAVALLNTNKRRRDFPVLAGGFSAGRLPELRSVAAREEAIGHLLRDVYAPSTRPSVEAKLRTIEKALAIYEHEFFPPTVEKIVALGAVLKAGQYRSGDAYLGLYKVTCERRGHAFTAPELRAVKDASRSVLRGLGGPVRAAALPFTRLSELPGDIKPWTPRGPFNPTAFIILGSWFMLREIEAAQARIGDVAVEVSPEGRPTLRWRLPVSKTDQRALGVSRVHGCSCDGAPSRRCPAHVGWAHLTAVRKQFGEVGPEFPMFPSLQGKICEKEEMAATIGRAAALLHVVVPANSNEKFTGHSLRVTGAQGLAAAGLDVWAVQLLGRWGSSAVKAYVRSAQLERASAWAAKVSKATALEDLLEQQSRSQPPASWKEALEAAAEVIKESARCPDAVSSCQASLAEPLATEMVTNAATTKGELGGFECATSSEGITHKVALGPPAVELCLAITSCGWKFGGGRTLLTRTVPNEYKRLCSRCFPAQRAAQKSALAASASKLEGP